ncbi:MAG: lipopolysaccharide heptosyltransferase I [Pyrinomonadaceae bacterium]
MKILIVKLGSIGDIIHTLPALAAIRAEMPDADISWAVEKRSAEILRGNNMLDRLIEVDTRSIRGGRVVEDILRGIRSQLRELRRYKFDVALDFQGLLKSAAIAKLSGAKIRFGFDKNNLREPASRVFLNRSVEIPPDTHIIRKNLMLAEQALNIPVPIGNFEFPIATEMEHKLESVRLIEASGQNFAILNPAGGWVTKLWHAEKYGKLADLLWEANGLISIVATGPGETDLSAAVVGASRSGKVLGAQPSLKGFYELARSAKVYVGGDTGPTHIAIAAGAPVVGIFGPTEWWRNGSPVTGDICVERVDIGCRVDCHRRTCSNWICMDITVETVFHAVQKRLGNA